MNTEQLEIANRLNEEIRTLTSKIQSLEFDTSENHYHPIGITINITSGTCNDTILFSFKHGILGKISKDAWKLLQKFLVFELTNRLEATKREFENIGQYSGV